MAIYCVQTNQARPLVSGTLCLQAWWTVASVCVCRWCTFVLRGPDHELMHVLLNTRSCHTSSAPQSARGQQHGWQQVPPSHVGPGLPSWGGLTGVPACPEHVALNLRLTWRRFYLMLFRWRVATPQGHTFFRNMFSLLIFFWGRGRRLCSTQPHENHFWEAGLHPLCFYLCECQMLVCLGKCES